MAVHVVWFNMVRTDARDRWPDDELTDPRARHWWDDGKTVGRAVAAVPRFKAWAPVAWDVWMLYPSGVTWEADDQAPVPVASGRTIVKTREELASNLRRLPARQAAAGAVNTGIFGAAGLLPGLPTVQLGPTR